MLELLQNIINFVIKLEGYGWYVCVTIIVILLVFLFRKIIEGFLKQGNKYISLFTILSAIVFSTIICFIYIKARHINLNGWNFALNVFISTATGGFSKDIVSAVLKIFKKESNGVTNGKS
jgi:hypothetical protein